jgi:hypothetical protein
VAEGFGFPVSLSCPRAGGVHEDRPGWLLHAPAGEQIGVRQRLSQRDLGSPQVWRSRSSWRRTSVPVPFEGDGHPPVVDRWTRTWMSITSFAARPGTDVDPMCSIAPCSASSSRRSCCANVASHRSSVPGSRRPPPTAPRQRRASPRRKTLAPERCRLGTRIRTLDRRRRSNVARDSLRARPQGARSSHGQQAAGCRATEPHCHPDRSPS